MNLAVMRITELIPPVSAPSPRNWQNIENRMGTPLPDDYKQLIDTYGGGVFDEVFWVLEPDCADEVYDLLAIAEERNEVLSELWNRGEPHPAELREEGTRLLPWAYGEGSGAYLYWLVKSGQRPEDWTVLINEGRGPGWEAHPVTCVQFLFSVMTGEINSNLFELPGPQGSHAFDSNVDIL